MHTLRRDHKWCPLDKWWVGVVATRSQGGECRGCSSGYAQNQSHCPEESQDVRIAVSALAYHSKSSSVQLQVDLPTTLSY